jgi:N-ethylmaleimide reductase
MYDTLFQPLQLGRIHLKHRVVMAPLTRSRADQPNAVPSDLMAKYYEQRATDGGLIVSEATNISLGSAGWYGAPGLYTGEQVEGWKKVLLAVHAKGTSMMAQLWHAGRAANVSTTGGATPVSASVNASYWEDPDRLVSTPNGWVQPSPHRALGREEIAQIVDDYRSAAGNAQDAGFDGVELHAGNGYLVDQFLQDGSNHREDDYGGTIANRTRLLIEVVESLVSVWGKGRVAVRIAPGGQWNGMSDSNSDALFGYVAGKMNEYKLAYLHVIEPRVAGNAVIHQELSHVAVKRLRNIFHGCIVSAGGFEPASAAAAIQADDTDAVAFGKFFISNPDLPARIQKNIKLTEYDRETFYTFDAHGYTDYPAATEG